MLAVCLTQDTGDAEQHILGEATTDLQIVLKFVVCDAVLHCILRTSPGIHWTG